MFLNIEMTPQAYPEKNLKDFFTRGKKLIFVLLILGIILPIISSDVLSINSGGGDNIIVNPNFYLDGFFSGDSDVSTPDEEDEDDQGEDEDGGGGGGGESVSQITVTPNNVTLNLAVNTNKDQTFIVNNTGDTTFTVVVSQNNLDRNIIISEISFILEPGETKNLVITFVALNQTGIFAGTLNIGGKTILINLNVKSKLLLFDSNIVVLNEDYIVVRGRKLKTSVTLIPMGDKERLDVVLNYVIKDFEGRDYLTRSETVLVEEEINFERKFDTGILPLGQYVVGLELVYPNGVAPSSAQFEVTGRKQSTFFGKIVLFLISAILIVLILMIIHILIGFIQRNKKKNN